MPRGAAELAVGRGPEAGVLLQADRVADRVVLDGPQLVGADPALREVVAGRQQVGRAEQAADVIGAERRCRARCHRYAGAWQTASTLFPSGSWTKAP